MKKIVLSSIVFLLFSSVINAQSTDPVKEESKKRAYNQKELQKREKKIAKVISSAKSLYKANYKEGQKSKKELDAVGLTYRAYKSVKIELPLSLEGQSTFGERKYIGEIERGDLLFFAISAGAKKLYSVGIVTKIEHGDVYFIQCTSVSNVKEYKLNDPKWKDRYVLARRII